jgi:hypothetical protein
LDFTLVRTLIHVTGLNCGSSPSDQQFASLFLQIPLTVKEQFPVLGHP